MARGNQGTQMPASAHSVLTHRDPAICRIAEAIAETITFLQDLLIIGHQTSDGR